MHNSNVRPDQDAADRQPAVKVPVPPFTAPRSQLRPPGSAPSLARFSLLNAIDELEATAQNQRPLLGSVVLTTQATVLYAMPNIGKTLITLALLRVAVGVGRITGSQCIYIAADDNQAGVIEKQRALKPYQVHVIAPGLKGFSAGSLRSEIEHMIATKSAGGSFVIVDTLKKFADLMDKKNSSAFGDLARRFVMAGGTILALAHANKQTDNEGRPIFAGTTDIRDDFDCAYTIRELPQKCFPNERVVQFDCIKKRGAVAQGVAYRYSIADGISYVELLDSVREIDDAELHRVLGEADQEKDADAIAAIEECIREGITSTQGLKTEASKRARLSHHKIRAILDRYEGPDPDKHRWTYGVFGRGRREYQLHGIDAQQGPAADRDEVF